MKYFKMVEISEEEFYSKSYYGVDGDVCAEMVDKEMILAINESTENEILIDIDDFEEDSEEEFDEYEDDFE